MAFFTFKRESGASYDNITFISVSKDFALLPYMVGLIKTPARIFIQSDVKPEQLARTTFPALCTSYVYSLGAFYWFIEMSAP